MKRTCLLFIVLSFVTMLLLACNEIENVNPEVSSVVEQKQTTLTRIVNVTQEEAYTIADRFVSSELGKDIFLTKGANTNSNLVKSSATVREDGQDLMHVFNFEGGGFIIIGATRNYYPILAYSDKGSFLLKDDMGPVDVWLDETKVCIKNSELSDETTKSQMLSLWARFDGTYTDPTLAFRSAHGSQTRSTGEDACWERIDSLQALYSSEGWTFLPLSFVEELFSNLGLSNEYSSICYSATQNHSALNETIIGYKNPVVATVGPLINTLWNQDSPFGDLCPNRVAGCAAVAAGQVMYYHQYPPTMTWAGDNFYWYQIPHEADSNSKQPHLMRMLGQKFQMKYFFHPLGNTSGTYDPFIESGLDSLGFYATLDSFTDNHPFNPLTVNNELFNYARPVIMNGTAIYTSPPDTSGHTWVCEGAQDIYVNRLYYFTENQPYGAGAFTQGMYSINNPGDVGNVNFMINFYMNWGEGENGNGRNGWFASNDVNSYYGNYKYNRSNIYVIKP